MPTISTMRTILEVIACVNCFIAGAHYSSKVGWANDRSEKITEILFVFLSLFFGVIYYALFYLLAIAIWMKLDGIFQLSFWFTWLFTTKWERLEKNNLRRINRIAVNKRNGKGFKDRHYRYCLKLINKVNNYTYSQHEPEF